MNEMGRKTWQARETRTMGSGLREHSGNQIRPLKPDDRPETTKEYARWETEEEDTLTKNKGDWVLILGVCAPLITLCDTFY